MKRVADMSTHIVIILLYARFRSNDLLLTGQRYDIRCRRPFAEAPECEV